MKKIFYLLFLTIVYTTSPKAQTITVSGQCISGTIILNSIGIVNGKPAYENTGTVQGIPGIQIDVYWLAAPDNLWVLAFSGQPYFQSLCNISTPPPTADHARGMLFPGNHASGQILW